MTKILQVGLGSMGQRRIRCLKKLGYTKIVGFDPRADRRSTAEEKYGIKTIKDWELAANENASAWIISTPPDTHVSLGLEALSAGAHFFAEAGIDDPLSDQLNARIQETGLVGAASCTMRYFFGPKRIKEIVQLGILGTPKTITYQSGQYLPDWHPWERYQDFYVSKKHTGACREIVPFELNWLIDIFGDIQKIHCMRDKITDLDTDIDDIYQLLMRFSSGLSCHLMVDVIAQPAVRIFRLCGTKGTLEWDHSLNQIKLYEVSNGSWQTESLNPGQIETGYIHQEEPYVEEIADFMAAIQGSKDWSNSFEVENKVIRALLAAEHASDTGVTQALD